MRLLFLVLALGCTLAATLDERPLALGGRRLQVATLVTTVLEDRASGAKLVEGVIQGVGLVTDPGCKQEGYICVQQRECIFKQARRALLATEVGGNVAGATESFVQETCGEPCQTQGYMTFSSTQRRLLSAEAKDKLFAYTLTQLASGTMGEAQAGLQRIVDAFNSGALDVCAGYTFNAGPAVQPSPARPLKPVQRYRVLVQINTRATSCADWMAKPKRSFVTCAAALAGQPSPFVSASCQERASVQKKRRLLITIAINRTGLFDDVKRMMDGLVSDIGDGSFSMCLWASGITNYKKLSVSSARMTIPAGNPTP